MENFLSTYQKLNADNLALLSEIYSPEIVFIDPAHEIQGLTPLTKYFANLYKNINHINFEFHQPLKADNAGYVQWTMTFSHPSMKKGQNITVEGATYIRFAEDGRVSYHRDHFDLGCMIYQHIPGLGRVIKTINRRLGT